MSKFWIRAWLVLAGIVLIPFIVLISITFSITYLVEKIKYGVTMREMWEMMEVEEPLREFLRVLRIVWKYGYYNDYADFEEEEGEGQ